jgi:hypothetical protein
MWDDCCSQTDADICAGEAVLKDHLSPKRPLSWAETKEIIHGNELHRLARSRAQEEKYQIYCDRLRKTWRFPVDYILHSKFGYDKRLVREKKDGVSSNNGTEPEMIDLWEVSPVLHPIAESNIRLCLNDFPYYFEEGIEHYILWKLKGSVTYEEIKAAEDHIINEEGRRERNKAAEIIHWVNPHHLKSLPEIDHAHILSYGVGHTAPENAL